MLVCDRHGGQPGSRRVQDCCPQCERRYRAARQAKHDANQCEAAALQGKAGFLVLKQCLLLRVQSMSPRAGCAHISPWLPSSFLTQTFRIPPCCSDRSSRSACSFSMSDRLHTKKVGGNGDGLVAVMVSHSVGTAG